jgi:hypothetical protein
MAMMFNYPLRLPDDVWICLFAIPAREATPHHNIKHASHIGEIRHLMTRTDADGDGLDHRCSYAQSWSTNGGLGKGENHHKRGDDGLIESNYLLLGSGSSISCRQRQAMNERNALEPGSA